MNKLSAFALALLSTTAIYAEGFVETINTGSDKAAKFTLLSDDPLVGGVVDTTLVTSGIALWGFTQWKWGRRSFIFTVKGGLKRRVKQEALTKQATFT